MMTQHLPFCYLDLRSASLGTISISDAHQMHEDKTGMSLNEFIAWALDAEGILGTCRPEGPCERFMLTQNS